MSIGRVERSVALYASGRIGKVASVVVDPCDVCRGVSATARVDGVAGVTVRRSALVCADRVPLP